MSPRNQPDHDLSQGTGSPMPGEPVFVVVGKLRRAHGVKGEMIMDVETDFPGRLRPHKLVYVGEEHEPLTLRTVRTHDQALLVSFDGYADCDVVAPLRNCYVYVKVSELPRLPEGEYYHHELVGLTVKTEQDHVLGTLVDILQTGANDVYVVEAADGQESLLPAIAEVILAVDLEKKEMRVRPQEWE